MVLEVQGQGVSLEVVLLEGSGDGTEHCMGYVCVYCLISLLIFLKPQGLCIVSTQRTLSNPGHFPKFPLNTV